MHEQLMVSERMASAGMLAAGVAHEINNPLAVAVSNVDYARNALRVFARELRALVDKPDDPGSSSARSRLDEVDAALGDAAEGLLRIRDIVVDVKLFSRPHDKLGAVDIHKVCDSSARMAWNEIRHRARLVKRYGDAPAVQANESRVGQVVLNLIVNAAQAMPEGRAENNEICIETSTDASGWAVVTVSDTGSGMPAHVVERIFEPFFTTKPVGVGTGLGLAVCHRIVNELGGTIDVTSEVGKGTTFRVAFPPGVGAAERERPSMLAPPVEKPARVLVVDDEVAMGAALQRTLSGHLEVVFVTRAEEALARIAKGEHFDVILSDFMMPDIGGMELHQRLQQIDGDLAKRVVFLTGGAFTSAGRLYLDGVANRVVEKPFRPSELLQIIRDVAGSR
jgi:CheY-like chemotaxis protein